jgi:hypothetical protein
MKISYSRRNEEALRIKSGKDNDIMKRVVAQLKRIGTFLKKKEENNINQL